MVVKYAEEKPEFMRNRLIYMTKDYYSGSVDSLLKLFFGTGPFQRGGMLCAKIRYVEKNFFAPRGTLN